MSAVRLLLMVYRTFLNTSRYVANTDKALVQVLIVSYTQLFPNHSAKVEARYLPHTYAHWTEYSSPVLYTSP